MRKNTLSYENQTLGIKSCLLHLSFGFYTLFPYDLELMAKGRSYPCIRIVFLFNSRKSYMSVPLQVSAVPVQVGYWCFSVWVYQYRLELYRYRLATGAFLYVTSKSGVSVDYPSTRRNTRECRVTRHFSQKSGRVSYVRGALPKYKICPKQFNMTYP